MKHKDLAETIGVSVVTMSRWVNNEMQPGMDTFLKIAGVLGVTVNDLLDTPGVARRDTSAAADFDLLEIRNGGREVMRTRWADVGGLVASVRGATKTADEVAADLGQAGVSVFPSDGGVCVVFSVAVR